MENASKALIIAGAILVSILLISVGIIIMNAINDPVSRGADSSKSQAIEIFNSQFTGFEGSEVEATTVKALIQKIQASNGVSDEDHQISYGDISSGANVNNRHTYSVTFSDYNEGYISEITITENE